MPRLATALIIIAALVLAASSSTADSPRRAYLPVVVQPGGALCDDLRIYDRFGTEQGWDWVIANYGAVEHWSQPGSACLSELREAEGFYSLFVDVGQPDVEVVFYWPDAPDLEPQQHNCGLDRGEIHKSDKSGRAELLMGPGAWYFPPDGGPHWVWILGSGDHGDCLGGIGMLGLTQYRHLDSVWRLADSR